MLLCCVKCTSILDKSMVGDVEVDLCPKCGGLWLDYGEVA
jgi:Zn-finger nucleic acid-binding protein